MLVSEVNNLDNVFEDWLYAPLQKRQNHDKEFIYPTRVFGLPKTHELKHNNCHSTEHLDFLIWILGFFVGMRLTTTEAGFLDNTSIKKGKLVDFVISNKSLENAVSASEIFWNKHGKKGKITDRIKGIIHSLFIAQNPQSLEFERFLILYIVLDACFKCIKDIKNIKEKIEHFKRVHWMCEQLGIATPGWAKINGNESFLSKIRNDSIHEALYFNKPLGFAVHNREVDEKEYSKNLTLEMEALVCRIIVWLIIGYNPYVKTPVNTRNMFSLEIDE
jgi:hypothetical protein